MVSDLSFITVSVIIDSWETIRGMQNYEDVVGLEIFKTFFDLAPDDAKAVFAFRQQNNELYESKRFRSHARLFVTMIDKALNLLGPDEELLIAILLEMGKEHSQWGVKPAFYPPLGQAILVTLEKALGDRFTPAVKDAWVEVYQVLSYHMIRASR